MATNLTSQDQENNPDEPFLSEHVSKDQKTYKNPELFQ